MENPGFIPLYERILIKPDEVEKETETGIILPPETRQRPNSGTIIAIGHLLQNSPFKIGDKVLYLKYSGLDIELNDTLYHAVMANDLIGIIDNSINKSFDFKTYE